MSPRLERARQAAGELRRTDWRQTFSRGGRALRQYGVVGTLRRARGLGLPYAWHRLRLADDIRPHPLPEGLELRCGGKENLSLYSQVAEDQDVAAAPQWLAAGGRLWLVVEESRTVFACWIFPIKTPVGEAPDGWLRLPEGTVCLEHSVTSPDVRGRGVAPGAWSAIAASLASDGLRTLVTKVDVDNVATQRSLAKVGFVLADPDEPAMRDFGRQLGR